MSDFPRSRRVVSSDLSATPEARVQAMKKILRRSSHPRHGDTTKDIFAGHRKLTFRCQSCGKTAKATEMASLLTTHVPKCPAGHGGMEFVRDAPKKPLRGRKPRWAWMGGVRIIRSPK